MARRRNTTANIRLQLTPPPPSLHEEKRTAYAAELVVAVDRLGVRLTKSLELQESIVTALEHIAMALERSNQARR